MTSSEPRATAVELEPTDEGPHPDRPPRRTATIVVAAAVIAALVVAAVFLRPGTGDVEVAVDEDEPSTTVPEPDGPDPAPAPIALGAPDDGKDSVGLPVSAEPSTGLIDGQTITVTGSGFPPGEQVGVVMCTREAAAEQGGRGVDACNIGHFGQGTSDQQGTVSIEFSVRRIMMLDGQEVDCASEPGRCMIGMGMLSDYDQSGGVAIDFDPAVPLPGPPEATLSKTTGLGDGEVVNVSVTGLRPNSYLAIEQCAEDGLRCVWAAELTADDQGAADGALGLWRSFGSWSEVGARPVNVDCAVEACELRLQGDTPAGRVVPPVALGFADGGEARVPPVLRLSDPGPYRHGDTLEILVEGLDAGVSVDLQVCPADTGNPAMCFAYSGAQYDGGGSLAAPLHIETGGGPDPCGGGCVLVVAVYWESHDGTPDLAPPLFPKPIPISITP